VLAEFVRVLRPGGNLVISDWRLLVKKIALPLVKTRPDASLVSRRYQRGVSRQAAGHRLALSARRRPGSLRL